MDLGHERKEKEPARRCVIQTGCEKRRHSASRSTFPRATAGNRSEGGTREMVENQEEDSVSPSQDQATAASRPRGPAEIHWKISIAIANEAGGILGRIDRRLESEPIRRRITQ
jgi:hypothetical protein